jgi:hypothetical protein
MADCDELRGCTLPPPRYVLAPLSPALDTIPGYKALQTYFPTLTDVFDIPKKSTAEFYFDTRWRIVSMNLQGPGNRTCDIELIRQDASGNIVETKETRKAYVKVTHLLNPIRWMENKYSLPKEVGLPAPTRSWEEAWTKLQDPWNQAYVEVLASYALGKLRERGLSPHFNFFYGSFCSIADTYLYNISDDLDSFRHARWFWAGERKKIYSLRVMKDGQKVSDSLRADVLDIDTEYINTLLAEESDSDTDTESSSVSEEELESGDIQFEDASMHSDDMESVTDVEGDDNDTEETGDDDEEEETVYASIKNFPVMLLCMEHNTATMDSLLSESHSEEKWAAWLFQVIAALCQIQALFGFTHNDLHTNNIVYVDTTDEYLYYKEKSGRVWRVPTYGKIFRIIDFGRSIFKLNGTYFISDDFREGNDADGQYAFKELNENIFDDEVVPPNPSFDLCRLAVSLFDGLFSESPAEKEDGRILSKEADLTIRETNSELCNMLWEWLIDRNGQNVLINPDGSDKFPSFDLYKHIAREVKNAVPRAQLDRALFKKWVWSGETTNCTVYPLFV